MLNRNHVFVFLNRSVPDEKLKKTLYSSHIKLQPMPLLSVHCIKLRLLCYSASVLHANAPLTTIHGLFLRFFFLLLNVHSSPPPHDTNARCAHGLNLFLKKEASPTMSFRLSAATARRTASRIQLAAVPRTTSSVFNNNFNCGAVSMYVFIYV